MSEDIDTKAMRDANRAPYGPADRKLNTLCDEVDRLRAERQAVRRAALLEVVDLIDVVYAKVDTESRAQFAIRLERAIRALADKPDEPEWTEGSCGTCGRDYVPCKSNGVVWTCRECDP